MKTAKLFMSAAILCATSALMVSCSQNDGEGDDHATQNETSIDTDETMSDGAMEDDISSDTTMMGDTTATM